jgi:hypothetical protein
MSRRKQPMLIPNAFDVVINLKSKLYNIYVPRQLPKPIASYMVFDTPLPIISNPTAQVPTMTDRDVLVWCGPNQSESITEVRCPLPPGVRRGLDAALISTQLHPKRPQTKPGPRSEEISPLRRSTAQPRHAPNSKGLRPTTQSGRRPKECYGLPR